MSKNSIALAFQSFGCLSHGEDWFCADFLDAHFPAAVQAIKNSNCSETAERLLCELQDQIAASSSGEAQRLIDWLQALRELRDDGDLRSVSERPGMNRGFVTE